MSDSLAITLKKPFAEQLAFFKEKLQLPSEAWDDIMTRAHDRAFIVAGAMKADLLNDLNGAVATAIEQGTGLEAFKKQFGQIVDRYGWQHTGSRDWRARVIYETNLRTSYAAGRYRQMTSPEVLQQRPYWLYRHSDASLQPRTQHKAWDGLILPAEDAWWNTHLPPNGWGCKCSVFPVSAKELQDKYGKDAPDSAPPVDTYEYTNKKTGEVTDVPVGIDYGWDYAPGQAALGKLFLDKMAVLPVKMAASAIEAALSVPAILKELSDNTSALVQKTLQDKVARRNWLHVGGLSPSVLSALEDRGLRPQSAVITLEDKGLLHATRDSKADAIPESFWYDLPTKLRHPTAILLDRSKALPALIFVYSTDSHTNKLVLTVDFNLEKVTQPSGKRGSIKTNYITTGAVVSGEKQMQSLKGFETIYGAI